MDKPSIGFWLSVIPALMLAWRLVWEQTSLSWEQGPQMVGFSLMHSGLGLVLMVALFAAMAWAAWVVAVTILSRRNRNVMNFLGALLVAVSAAAVFAPYGFWVRLFAERIAQGPHASAFLVHMAAIGDISAVGALLDQGVPVNESNSQGLRAVEAAENAKQPEMLKYLTIRGGTEKRF